MNRVEEFIEMISQNLPDLCDTNDLVKLGIFSSAQAAAYCRKNNSGPECIKLPHLRYRYPKTAVIDYIKKSNSL